MHREMRRYTQWIDGVPYKLEAPFDFSFLSKYGKVFKAFDEQGSGNISFGVQNGEEKLFIKFAGAPKKNYIAHRDSGAVDAESAIALLKAAVPLYTALKHPTLISLIATEEIGGGYAAIFEWEEAIIDEITNVYTMGATAFALFAYGNRATDSWPLSKVLYDVAKKAVSDNRSQRQQSIRQFMAEWRAARLCFSTKSCYNDVKLKETKKF